jgi:hypothetical protein
MNSPSSLFGPHGQGGIEPEPYYAELIVISPSPPRRPRTDRVLVPLQVQPGSPRDSDVEEVAATPRPWRHNFPHLQPETQRLDRSPAHFTQPNGPPAIALAVSWFVWGTERHAGDSSGEEKGEGVEKDGVDQGDPYPTSPDTASEDLIRPGLDLNMVRIETVSVGISRFSPSPLL